MMKSLFSVSRLIGKSQTRSSKRTSSVKSTFQEDEDSQSQKRVVVDSTPSAVTAVIPVEDEASEANSGSETLPKEQDFSFPPTPSPKSEVNKTHERKTETLEETGYDVVLQPSAKASFADWTELDTGSGPAAKAFDAEGAQVGIDINVEGEQSLAKVSNGTDWTPFDVSETVEEPSASLPSDAEWLQLDTDKKTKEEKEVAVLPVEENGEIISETRVEEERAAHLEEMRIVRDEKEKLTERVKELEEELHQAEHKLQLKTEQISKFVVDLDRKGEEIKVLNEEKEHIQKVAAREKAECLVEVRRSNEAIAARWQVAKELNDVETAELLAKQEDDMQEALDNMIVDLSESRARVAELESANELQAKKLLEQDTTSASQNDAIAALKGQKAKLIALVHTLRTDAKINERQNSMLMVQLKQQSDNLVAWDIPSTRIAKSVRRTTGPTLVEQAVRTIKALNDEIYQIAASLTDCVDEIEKRFVDEFDGTAAALETLKSLLGTEIYAELVEQSCCVKDDYNPYILQTGFQVCLAACCMRIITSWYPAEPEYGKFLEAVYERIRGYGGAENAAQWRKWTLQSCTSSTNTVTKSILFDFIIYNLYAMLSMSGWPRLGETANLLDKFSDKITEIVNLAVRLNTLAAETALPGDLQVVTVEEGKDYVSHDMVKDIPEGGWDNMRSDAPYSEAVVGCVGLGLKWRDEGDMYEAQLVLKPRVVLRKDKSRW